MNGIWLLFLLGRWSMVTGWIDLAVSATRPNKREFVSVDARLDDLKKGTRSYEMLSRDSGKTMDDVVTPSVVSPISPFAKSPASPSSGRRTPDYFGQAAARYHVPARSFSSPKPPQTASWSTRETYSRSSDLEKADDSMHPLGMNQI